MSESHHTSGVWTRGIWSPKSIRLVSGDNLANNGNLIAEFFGPDAEANCNIAIAAPDLLEALEIVVQAPDEGWSLEDYRKLIEKCRTAITKAKGQ